LQAAAWIRLELLGPTGLTKGVSAGSV